ncbi:hypothetical protein JW865_06625, partial [Candidatus Bathyarchaeota archaeon]|nr:hypothetical protein [Candidatus Bathyarchaeota archaeon]
EGLKEEGLEVTMHNANEGRFPIADFSKYDCVAFGTPDYFGYLAGTIKTFMDDWYINRNQSGMSGKSYVVFYSHGGGGRVKDALSLFSRVGTMVGTPVGSRGAPTPEILLECKTLGVTLAKSLK